MQLYICKRDMKSASPGKINDVDMSLHGWVRELKREGDLVDVRISGAFDCHGFVPLLNALAFLIK